MCTRGLIKASTLLTLALPPWSTNTNSPTKTQRKCSKSWSCSIQYATTMPRTGFTSNTSPSLPTRPSSHSANSWSPAARCFRRPMKKAVQSSLPWAQQPPQHLPYIMMPSQPNSSVCSVAITIPQATPHPMARSATDVVATNTSPPYVEKDCRDHPKVSETSPQ